MSSLRTTPWWWPTQLYYGWAIVGALGFTACISYGILSYGFATFIAPMQVDLHWSNAQITGGFSLAQLVAGGAAIPVGRWVDRYGPRALMTAGSVLAAICLVVWAHVHSLAAYYGIMSILGLALAAVLYEPAFATIATWFNRDRGRALTLLTFVGGFASVIFVPLASQLIFHEGWRKAMLTLAAIIGALTIGPHLLVLRRSPADLDLLPDGAIARDGNNEGIAEKPGASSASVAIRTRSFMWIAAAFGLSGFATTAISVHLVPLLLDRGYQLPFAGAAMGTLGLMALPGRLLFTPLGDVWPRSAVTASIFILQLIGTAVLLFARGTVGVWVFVILFGAGFGAIAPARAALGR